MPSVLTAAFALLVASGSAPVEGYLVAHGARPALEEVNPLLLQALPAPPGVVVRTTKRYGEVTIDHPKHLAVRAPCGDCHLTLPVSKITFTPQEAHRNCIGCHKERSSGPTQCAGCHVKSLPPPVLLAEAEEEEEAASPAAPPPAPLPLAARAPGAGRTTVEVIAPASRQLIELGYVAGTGFGPSLRVSSRWNRLVTSYSFERVERSGDARLLGLLGVGLARPVHDRVDAVVLALAGFDAVETPAVTVAPALGARAALEWRVRRWRLETIQLGVTGVVDLSRGRAFGRDVPGTAFYATVGAGLSTRRPAEP